MQTGLRFLRDSCDSRQESDAFELAWKRRRAALVQLLAAVDQQDFFEINNSAEMANDDVNQGRWGNGNVDFVLTSLDDFPYALRPIRQALEQRAGNETSSCVLQRAAVMG